MFAWFTISTSPFANGKRKGRSEGENKESEPREKRQSSRRKKPIIGKKTCSARYLKTQEDFLMRTRVGHRDKEEERGGDIQATKSNESSTRGTSLQKRGTPIRNRKNLACSSPQSFFLHIRHLLDGLHHVAVQQLHHLGLAVHLEVGPGKGFKGPSSAAGDPAAAAVHARQLASYADLKVRVEQSLVEAEPRSRVWHLGHVAHVDHQREAVVVFLDAGVPVVHVGREDGGGGCGVLLVDRGS